jgi:hypothetical protein
MDEQLREKIDLKIREIFDSLDEINILASSLGDIEPYDKKSFYLGVLAGKLYNSFYYQCRRILKRDPTKDEFLEFVEIVKQEKSKFLENIRF